MKVILTEDLRGTGKKGEAVEVRDGYGRNYLVPRGLALLATEGNTKRFGNIVKSIQDKKGRTLKTATDTKEKLEEILLTIRKRAGADGKLFGSVTHKDVADAIKEALGLDIDRKGVRINEPIRSTGAYTLEIHLEQNVNATVKVEVEKKE
jgi:large subunit ribosomal protein L9